MSIPLFAHDANPDVDAPVCYRTREQAIRMLEEGSAKVLLNSKGKEWAIQFKPIVEHTLRSQLAAYLENHSAPGAPDAALPLLELFQLSSSSDSNCAITDAESRANVGDAKTAAEIIRAQAKIRAYPGICDDRAVLVSPNCRA